MLYELGNKSVLRKMGSKASHILFLKKNGFNIPKTYIIPYSAYDKFISNQDAFIRALQNELDANLNKDTKYAIRSSADIEDGSDLSYAGQFESYLNIDSTEKIIDAIIRIWQSVLSPSASKYSKDMKVNDLQIKMGVIIQEMIEADFSGIAFSKNPMTGLNEIIVEALEGSADQMTQAGITPMRWVRKWGIYTDKPKDSPIPESEIEKICIAVKSLEKSFKSPVDIEWAVQEGILYILQIRNITMMDIPIYSNKISREMLPGLIKPLVFSINTSIINPCWANILHDLVGGKRLDPDLLTGYFYHRAYFNMAFFRDVFVQAGMPGEALELLMRVDLEGPEKPRFKPGPRTFLIMPRMLFFVFRLLFIGLGAKKLISTGIDGFRNLEFEKTETKSDETIMQNISRIKEATGKVAHYNIIIPLLSSITSRIVASKFKKNELEFNYDYTLYGNEKTYSGPLDAIGRMNLKFFRHGKTVTLEEFISTPEFSDFVYKFGHFSDSGNDFSYVPWRETPGLIYDMVKNHAAETADKSSETLALYKKLLRKKPLLRFLYKKAANLELYREEISSIYTYVYGLLRPMYLEIGKRLVKKGFLSNASDIFYIYKKELEESYASGNHDSFLRLSSQRKESMKNALNLSVPMTIFGNTPPPVSEFKGTSLKGVPTSHGFYTGIAKVLMGTDDMDKLKDGEVLVIPYSDVGWTPLFSKAGAVVAESGGVLSHSSIVAREYGIPAVVSVENACSLEDGITISVNGYTGEIHIVGSEEGGNE